MILSPSSDGECAETGTPVLPRSDFSEKEKLAREEGGEDWDDVGVPSMLNSEVTGFSGVSREDRQETSPQVRILLTISCIHAAVRVGKGRLRR
jgi:hypothetical protein